MIMPLAKRRDKYTQVIGASTISVPVRPRPGRHVAARDGGRSRDARYAGRARESVHDPRAASGHCCAGSASEWMDVTGGRIDPTRAYKCTLPSGQDDRDLLLRRPDLAGRRVRAPALRRGRSPSPAERVLRRPRLGRSWCTSRPTAKPTATITATATWRSPMRSTTSKRTELREAHQLRRVPREVPADARGRDPREHRLELRARRRALEEDCGCNSGGHGGWNQEWRGPLREALDWLRDEVAPTYEQRIGAVSYSDPWAARNDYIEVVLDRSPEVRERFLQRARARAS